MQAIGDTVIFLTVTLNEVQKFAWEKIYDDTRYSLPMCPNFFPLGHATITAPSQQYFGVTFRHFDIKRK
jgi:hypothetical protein